ncbi:hypothetical protein CLV98_101817 [Dyadobacter jejuensis]|uniref:Purine nucleoside phosphorylase n=1 Tax=Dyadobacter jejuensis TaxID=1082580 RepID=A0A316AST3_9BACT|nr:peptidoglycan editing factor PgeF [Dyadobacter jejuensis]PWJ60632.1 hypothetical protein CLV98_101817 [Dyadobacter jejuensis]
MHSHIPTLFRNPTIWTSQPRLIAAESTRHGGVSLPPYHSLNLGGQGTDSPENILENNHRFFNALQVSYERVAKSHQIHGTEVLHVTEPGAYQGYDALVTNHVNIQLAVTIADCTPILIFDPVQGAIAAIHAGWRGTAGKIVEKTLKTMEATFHTQAKDCQAYIGTCIDYASFEVGPEVAEHFDQDLKDWDPSRGKFMVDLKGANRKQLLAAGLQADQIEVSPYSTVLNSGDYFSYRHEQGTTGRMLATIGLRF